MKYAKPPLSFPDQADRLLEHGLDADRDQLIHTLQRVSYSLFRGLEASVKQAIAANYGIADRVLESWLVAGNTLRNLCAHHARLWDRVHGTQVMIPRANKHPDWHRPVNVAKSPRRNFAQLTVLRYLLRHIAPRTGWPDRLEQLWSKNHPNIPTERMGFPPNWKECPIWSKCLQHS